MRKTIKVLVNYTPLVGFILSHIGTLTEEEKSIFPITNTTVAYRQFMAYHAFCALAVLIAFLKYG